MTDSGKRRPVDLHLARSDIEDIFESALKGADAGRLVRGQVSLDDGIFRAGEHTFPLDRYRRVHLFGIGKVAAHMAAPLERLLGDRISGGLVIVKYGYGKPLQKIPVMEAGHPIPDSRGLKAARAMIGMIREIRGDDLVLFLVSGGGSSLLVMPAGALTLDEKIRTNRVLLRSGAPINEINAVRKRLSAVKGGKLTRLIHPASVVNLILSDVVGDPLEDIASGPTVPPERPGSDPMTIVERYGLIDALPRNVLGHLQKREEERVAPPATPLEIRSRVKNVLVGNNRSLLEGARRRAEELGYTTRILTSSLAGEARVEAGRLSRIALDMRSGQARTTPVCLLAGGETTVTVKGKGTGGRCTEFALSAALSLDGEKIIALAAGSDGTDGPTDAAGAIVDGTTCQKGRKMGMDPTAALEANDSYTFFRSTGDLIVTGPTRTNVMDLYAFIVPKN